MRSSVLRRKHWRMCSSIPKRAKFAFASARWRRISNSPLKTTAFSSRVGAPPGDSGASDRRLPLPSFRSNLRYGRPCRQVRARSWSNTRFHARSSRAGYANLPLESPVRMRGHGVTSGLDKHSPNPAPAEEFQLSKRAGPAPIKKKEGCKSPPWMY